MTKKGTHALSLSHSPYQIFIPCFFHYYGPLNICLSYSEFSPALRGHQVLLKVSVTFSAWWGSLKLYSTGHKIYLWSLSIRENKSYQPRLLLQSDELSEIICVTECLEATEKGKRYGSYLCLRMTCSENGSLKHLLSIQCKTLPRNFWNNLRPLKK